MERLREKVFSVLNDSPHGPTVDNETKGDLDNLGSGEGASANVEVATARELLQSVADFRKRLRVN